MPSRVRESTPHTAIAQRFIDFCEAMDSVNGRTALDEWLKSHTLPANSRGCKHITVNDKDARVALPIAISRKLKEINSQFLVWEGDKVQGTWITLYLANKLPSRTADWQVKECSHLCLDNKCLTESHLEWESKQVNQSRGHCRYICRKRCQHGCGETLCSCAKLHTPPCIQ